MDNCVTGAARQAGALTPEEYARAKREAPSVVAYLQSKGKADFDSFKTEISGKGEEGYDARWDGVLSRVWLDAVDAYNATAPARLRITPTLKDYVPEYNIAVHVDDGPQTLASELGQGLRSSAAHGLLSEERVVKEGYRGINFEQSKAGAVRLMNSAFGNSKGRPLTVNELLGKAGVTMDQAVFYYSAVKENLANQIRDLDIELSKARAEAEYAQQKGLPSSAVEAAEANALALDFQRAKAMATFDAVYAMEAGNSTQIGRAFRALQETNSVLAKGSAKANRFNEMFQDDAPPRSATDTKLKKAEAVVSAKAAADAVIGKDAEVGKFSDSQNIPQDNTDFSNAEAIGGLARKLHNTYDPSSNSAMQQRMLVEVGLHARASQEGGMTFEEWSAAVQKATGRRIAPEHLFDAYQDLRRTFFERVKKQRDLQAAALSAMRKSVAGEQMEKAIAEIKAIDPNSPDAQKRYSEIIKKYQSMAPVHWWTEVPSIRRAVRTAFDMSAPFRQAAMITIGWGFNPIASVPKELAYSYGKDFGDAVMNSKARQRVVLGAMIDMASAKSEGWARFVSRFTGKKVINSDAFAEQVMNELDTRPTAELHWRHKLARTNVGENAVDLSGREEEFMSRLTEMWRNSDSKALRYMGEGIHGSERAYAVYLNRIRADAFDLIAANWQRDGVHPDVNPEKYDALAAYINDMTGRSEIPFDKASASSKLLASTFFAARFQISRFKNLSAPVRAGLSDIRDISRKGGPKAAQDSIYEQELNSRFNLDNMPKELRREVYGNMARVMGSWATLAGLAYLAGAEIDLDPRSSDFTTFKVGNTRIDILGGEKQWMTFLARMATGQTVDKQLRMTKTLGGNAGRQEAARQFIMGKLAPFPSDVAGYVFGKNAVGEDVVPSLDRPNPLKFTPEELAVARDQIFYGTLPMHVKDVADGYTDSPVSFLLSALSYFGIGVQTYDQNKPRRRLPAVEPPVQKALPVLKR